METAKTMVMMAIMTMSIVRMFIAVLVPTASSIMLLIRLIIAMIMIIAMTATIVAIGKTDSNRKHVPRAPQPPTLSPGALSFRGERNQSYHRNRFMSFGFRV